MFSSCLVDHLSDDVDRCQHNADRRVEGCPLGVVAVSAARVDRRDRVSEHWDVF